jgi:hypothetical protein
MVANGDATKLPGNQLVAHSQPALQLGSIRGLKRNLGDDLQLDRERCGLRRLTATSPSTKPGFIFNQSGLVRVEAAQSSRLSSTHSAAVQISGGAPTASPTPTPTPRRRSRSPRRASSLALTSTRTLASTTARPPGALATSTSSSESWTSSTTRPPGCKP